MLDFLLTPLAFPFMQRALIASVLVGGLCAVIGHFSGGCAFRLERLRRRRSGLHALGMFTIGGFRGSQFSLLAGKIS